MVLVEIAPEQFQLAWEGWIAAPTQPAREIGQVNTPDHQLKGRGECGLIEFAIAGNVAVARF